MIGRTLWMVLAAMVLSFGLMAMPASAVKGCSPLKKGIKGCKNEIQACVASECAGLTKKDLRLCKKACKVDTKNACSTNTALCTGSPSGAFLQ